MISSSTVETGAILYDRGGSKVGTVTDVVLNEATLQPEWYEVKVGRVARHHLLPARSLETDADGRCTVPFDKDTVKSAPHAASPPDGPERKALLEHYGLPTSSATSPPPPAGPMDRIPDADQPARPELTASADLTARPDGTVRPPDTAG
jgi:hypothetical protein